METLFSSSQEVNFNDLPEIIAESETMHYGKIGFAFLDDHCGLRPGQVHVLCSNTSSGKSTLAKTIFARYSYENKVLWYSSEESLRSWKLKFAKSEKRPRADNIKFVYEKNLLEIDIQSVENFFKHLSMQIEQFQAKILFFDNLTASLFYNDKTPKEQSEFLSCMRDFVEKQNIPIFLVVHLAKNAQAVNFKSNDVRGNNTLPTIAQYWYNFYRLRSEESDRPDPDVFVSLLHVEKSRDHGSVNDTAYQLFYSQIKNEVFSDKKCTWAFANELMAKSQKLGKK